MEKSGNFVSLEKWEPCSCMNGLLKQCISGLVFPFSALNKDTKVYHVRLHQSVNKLPTLALKPRGDVTHNCIVWASGCLSGLMTLETLQAGMSSGVSFLMMAVYLNRRIAVMRRYNPDMKYQRCFGYFLQCNTESEST